MFRSIATSPCILPFVLLLGTACGPSLVALGESSEDGTGSVGASSGPGGTDSNGGTTGKPGTAGATAETGAATTGPRSTGDSDGTAGTDTIDMPGGSSGSEGSESTGAVDPSDDTSGGVIDLEPTTWTYHDPHWEVVRGLIAADDGVFVYFLAEEADEHYWGRWVKLNDTLGEIAFELTPPAIVTSPTPLSVSTDAFFVAPDPETSVLERRDLSTGALAFAVELDTDRVLDVAVTQEAVFVVTRTDAEGGGSGFPVVQMLSPDDGTPMGWTESEALGDSLYGSIETDGSLLTVILGGADPNIVVLDASTGELLLDVPRGDLHLPVMAPGGPYFTTQQPEAPSTGALLSLSGDVVFSTEAFVPGQFTLHGYVGGLRVALSDDAVVISGTDTVTGMPRYERLDSTSWAPTPEFGDNGALLIPPWEDGHQQSGTAVAARNDAFYTARLHIHPNTDRGLGFRHWYIERRNLSDGSL